MIIVDNYIDCYWWLYDCYRYLKYDVYIKAHIYLIKNDDRHWRVNLNFLTKDDSTSNIAHVRYLLLLCHFDIHLFIICIELTLNQIIVVLVSICNFISFCLSSSHLSSFLCLMLILILLIFLIHLFVRCCRSHVCACMKESKCWLLVGSRIRGYGLLFHFLKKSNLSHSLF